MTATTEPAHRVQDRATYRWRLGTLGAGALAGLVLLVYLIWFDHQQALRAAEVKTRDYAAILETRLDATLRRADAHLLELVRDFPVAALSKQEEPRYASMLNAQLDSRIVNFPELAGLRVFDTAGDQLYSSDRANTPRGNVFDRDYFRRLSNDPQADLVFSEVNISRTTGRPTLVASRAVRDSQGVFRGIVIASIELDYFQKLFQSLDLDSRSVVSIYRRDDFSLVVRWPVGDRKFNTKLPPENPTRAVLASDKKTLTARFPASNDGVVRIYSFHVLDRYPFYVSVGVALDEALAAWRTRALGVGLSGLLLVGLLIRLLFRLWRTEARQAQSIAALVQSDVRFRELFDRASDGIMIMSLTGSLIAVNESFARMHGYTTHEMQALNLKDLDTPETSRLVPERMKRILSGEFATFEVEHYHKNGRAFPLEVSSSLIVSGGETLIQTFHRDISGRKQAELLLRENEERYRTVADYTYDWEYWVLPDGSLPYVSPSCEHISGYPAQAFKQDPSLLVSIVHPDDREQFEAHLNAAETPGTDQEHYARDFRIITRHGEERWIAHVCQHIHGENGKYLGRRASNRDISDRKRAEAERARLEVQLRESQKMEAIGTLAGGIAHDFNNALATILGNVELARQDVGPAHPALESLEEIQKAGSRTRDLVQQILSFSRRQSTERKPTALAPIVANSARLMRATLPARLTLDVHCEADVPPVLADASQIQQIVINLVTNAAQAMKSGGGRIGLRLDTVMLGAALAEVHPRLADMHARYQGCAVRLVVNDNGPGMDAGLVERIFEPFFTTKPVGEGTGLGLSVVHGIVQAHQGAIVVDSAPGKGTTFTLYLPAIETPAGIPAADQGKSPAATSPATGPALSLNGGQHLLYLDDDESLVLLVQRLLERRGFRVSGYTDQGEALDALRADPHRFDLVVSDYNMPGMSGLDVAREVRAIRADLPMAIASGFIDEELRAQAGGAGVLELIFKADRVEDLCEAFVRLTQTVEEKSKPS